MKSPDLILEARSMSKRYGRNLALDDAEFFLHRNAINVLIGENGAGKSTLMRILAGVEAADSGTIVLDGNAIVLDSPRAARDHGIAIVHQELSILPNLDLSENVFAGRELTRSLRIDRLSEDSQTTKALTRLHKLIPVQTPVSQLSLGSRQIVELARALAHGARILILDEPTSALSVTETETLFEVLADLKAAGVSIVYISHRLHELLHLGDYFTVLRAGRVVGHAARAQVTRQWIVERMSGRADTSDFLERADHSSVPALRVSKIALPPSTGSADAQAALYDVSFTLHRGEILGIYGLLGAGRTELIEVLAGSRRAVSGTLSTDLINRLPRSVHEAIAAGIVLVPEDRQRDGIIPELSVRENITLAASSGPLLSRKSETIKVRQLVADLAIAVKDIELPVTALSGGNQQKVLLARCLMRNPDVLLLDEPSRGIDAGAKVEIYRILRALADKGLSILFTSSEIEETRLLADRVLVMCRGRISSEFSRKELSNEALFAAASPGVSFAANSATPDVYQVSASL